MSEIKPGQPNIELTENPNPTDFEPTEGLDVIDAEQALEQCCDWSFVVELLEDVLKDRDDMVSQLKQATEANDATSYHKSAHALKGAALNLHLPALVDVSRKAELLGKQLEITPEHKELLDMRELMIDHLHSEYDRLDAYIPEAKLNAEQELNDQNEEEEQQEEEDQQDEEN